MEWAIAIAVVLVFLWWRLAAKAGRVLRQRAADLARITNIPAARIEREMLDRRITPGQWALEHGLDPIRFQPVGQFRPEGNDALGRPFGTLDEMQAEVDQSMKVKRERLQVVKQRLLGLNASPEADKDELGELETERRRLETFFWLARGGDQKGEPRPQ